MVGFNGCSKNTGEQVEMKSTIMMVALTALMLFSSVTSRFAEAEIYKASRFEIVGTDSAPQEPVANEVKYSSMRVYSNYNAYAYEPFYLITKGKAAEIVGESVMDENGFMRIGEYYLAALGTYYGSLGSKFKITMDSGLVYKVIKGDTKSDSHTVYKMYGSTDGSYVEFIVNYNKFVVENLKPFQGSIVSIEMEVQE